MQRFQMDRPIMIRRWRQEWQNHGRDFGKCHCGLGMGTMRKHRPGESHSPGRCRLCDLERVWARQVRRRERYGAHGVIIEGLSDAQSH